VVTFLLYSAYELLNREFAQFTWENGVELMRGEKQETAEPSI
jgi:hypothetical protein